MYRLTQEAEKYLEQGTPERKLIELLNNGAIPINEAKNKIDNFSIALGWAKRNGWVIIKNGLLKLVKKPESFEQENALRDIKNNKKVDERLIKILLGRKLIEEVKETVVVKARKQIKKKITKLTPELIKTGLWREIDLKPYNVEVVGKKIHIGKRQPYNQFLSSVRQKLVELGFKEMTGPLIETEFWNFDALYQPQNHSARDWTDTYRLKYPKRGNLPRKKIVERVKAVHENGWTTGSSGWGYKWDPDKAAKLMPRAHGTCLSARCLAHNVEIPGKYFSIARCFRPDIIDATHLLEFNQVEGIVIDPDLTFRDLLGILKMFAIEFADAEKIKFYGDYYPFTEPSVQLSAKHPKLGWIEFGGAGIFREELTRPLGVDVPVIAWGLGIDRLAMFKLGIKDIRYLFAQNLKWLREKEVI